MLRSLFGLALVVVMLGCGGKTSAEAPADGAPCTGCVDSGGPDTSIVGDTTRAPEAAPPPDVTTRPGAEPPPRPGSVGTGETRYYVVKFLQLGINNKTSGRADPNAWKQFGYDLDRRTTTGDDSRTSANSCHRRAGSPSLVLTDGDEGRDNNFGAHVMQTLRSLRSDVEDAASLTIASGGATLLLRLDNVGADDNAAVPGKLWVTTPTAPPRFDGTDSFPVDAAYCADGDPNAPLTTFPSGYMAGGVWVSGDVGGAPFRLPLAIAGAPMVLPMAGGVLSFRVADGSDGTLAGVLRTGDFATAFTPLAESFGLCPGNATFDQVVATITQSADLVSGAPDFQNTSVECNSISVGIGFRLAPALAPSRSEVSPPPKNACGPDAG